jgi:8-oxo-dGTP diphosphatase/2-hydroxy-dATP diphosphatase
MRKKVTNVYLVRGNEVCLGMKKRGFGQGMWNGTGGKVGKDETTKEAAKREAKEEFGVDLIKLKSMGKILFVF